MSEGRDVSAGSLLLAFLSGAAIGAVVALLTAPKSGRETRNDVADWARRSGLGDALTRATRAARDAFDRSREA